jgi:hypothetical protein
LTRLGEHYQPLSMRNKFQGRDLEDRRPTKISYSLGLNSLGLPKSNQQPLDFINTLRGQTKIYFTRQFCFSTQKN